MKEKESLWEAYQLYNLSRYIFLRIENEYKQIVEVSGITLPQLRVLWIVKAFPGISLGEIAQIGCWTPPTVTKMLQILMNKKLIEKDVYDNKKVYRLQITSEGEKYIEINKLKHNENFPLWKLYNYLSEDEIRVIISIFKDITINCENEIILNYIEKLNKKELKFNYEGLSLIEREKLESIVCLYNLLRVFILNVEGEHRKQLNYLNITYPQLRALWFIEAFPGLTSSMLSEISFWAPSTSNIIVKNLYGKDLIYKKKSEVKNSLYLFISEKGENLILQDFKDNQNKLTLYEKIERLDRERVYKTNEIFRRINKYLGNDKVDAYIEKTLNVIKNRISSL
jgi:DNA-binding MarR family transcriptional regulator